MYSKATSSSFCWTRWRARCPAYPATTATASDVPHQREEKRRERRDQSAHAASRQRLASYAGGLTFAAPAERMQSAAQGDATSSAPDAAPPSSPAFFPHGH